MSLDNCYKTQAEANLDYLAGESGVFSSCDIPGESILRNLYRMNVFL